jgi:hypothetical protein
MISLRCSEDGSVDLLSRSAAFWDVGCVVCVALKEMLPRRWCGARSWSFVVAESIERFARLFAGRCVTVAQAFMLTCVQRGS